MSRLKKLGLLNREGMNALNCGKMDDAMFQLLQADRLARDLASPLHEAKVRNNIGLVHQAAGRAEEAMACFRLARESAIQGAGVNTQLRKIIDRNLNRLEKAVGRAA